MQILKGHLSGKSVFSVAFSPGGTKLASCGHDGQTFLWDLHTGDRRVLHDQYACGVAFSPDGRAVAAARYRGVAVWTVDPAQLRFVELADAGFGGEFAFTADGRTLLTAGWRVGIWDIDSGSPLPSPDFDSRGGFATASLALTPDRRSMATGHKNPHVVRLWDVETRSLRDEITGPTAIVSALALSPNGHYLAATAGTTLWVWEVASKRVAVKHSIDRKYFKDVAFTPDGRFLVFARNDATVSLWYTSSWTEAAAYDFGIGPMVSVACAPDGMRAAGGSTKGKIVVFDIDV